MHELKFLLYQTFFGLDRKMMILDSNTSSLPRKFCFSPVTELVWTVTISFLQFGLPGPVGPSLFLKIFKKNGDFQVSLCYIILVFIEPTK
jgi:hypothetical protein